MMEHWIYLLPIAAVGYLLWSRRSAPVGGLKAMLARGGQILDVRTKAEFQSHSHSKARNIPLDQLQGRLKELDKAKPVLVCCESGSRSASALAILKQAGFSEVANLGSWRRIQSLLD
jgi:rhodanese-related sulfurtransferase